MGASESCAKAINDRDQPKAIEEFYKLINSHGDHIIFQPSEKYKTTLFLAACKTGMSGLCAKMLSYPLQCHMQFIDDCKNTAFIYACINDMEHIAHTMLSNAELCSLDQLNNEGQVALNYINMDTMEKVVLKLLRTNKPCGLHNKNLQGLTPLMVACAHKNETIALEILKKHGVCALYDINPSNQSAFDIAAFNNMRNVAHTIIELYSPKKKALLSEKYGSNKCFANIFRGFYKIKPDDPRFDECLDDNDNNSDNSEDAGLNEEEFLSLVTMIDPYLETQFKANQALYPPDKNVKYYKNQKPNKKRNSMYKTYMPPTQVEHYYLGSIKVCILD